MSAFKDRIRNYNAQKETKVNPPEAAKVLEEKSAPEVESVRPSADATSATTAPDDSARTQPAASTQKPSGDAPVVAAEPSATASAEAPKARGRGRPAGSKNSPKPPADAPASEATSAAPPATSVVQAAASDDPTAAVRALLALPGKDGRAFAVEAPVLVEALFVRGYGVTRL